MAVDSSTQRSVTRRTVLRTGAHAAWAVPAISVATAAPAFAVSGGASLQGSSFKVQFNSGTKKFHVMVGPIKNTGGSPTGGPVTVVVSAPKTTPTTMSNPYDNGVQNNWTYLGSSSGSSTTDYTFVSKASSLKPNQSTGALSFFLSTTTSRPSGTWTYVASATGSTSTMGTTTSKSSGGSGS